MRSIRRVFVLAAILLLPCAVWAQVAVTPVPGPPGGQVFYAQVPAPPGHPPDLGKWWKNSRIARELGLSEAQISQIEQTFLEQRLKLIDLRADLEKQEARLQPLIEADQPDEAKVSAQIDQVLAARGRLEKANAMMMLAIRRVLSVEQWKKLQSFQQEREREFHRMMAPPMVPGPNGAPPGATPPPALRPPEE